MVSMDWALSRARSWSVSTGFSLDKTSLPTTARVLRLCLWHVGKIQTFMEADSASAPEGLNNHARPLNSLVSQLNDAIYGPLQLPG